uniref:Uncharacterized protein n=1 Tax=Rhizophora mucronata TaxID=61149 RepID=A0A2P2N9P0_RHIMU
MLFIFEECSNNCQVKNS